MKNGVGRAIRSFLMKNSVPLTGMTSLIIIIEGSVLWFYPQQWWKPLLGLFGVLVIVIIWMNARVMIRAGLSIIGLIILSALAVLTGASYSGSSLGGSILGMSVIFTWLFILTASYFMTSTRSRWMTTITSAAVTFGIEYGLLTTGDLRIILSIGVGIGIVFGLIVLKSDIFIHYGKNKIHILGDDDDHDQVHHRIDKIMRSLWPSVKSGSIKTLRGKSLWVWYSTGGLILVIIPAVMDEGLNPDKKGFTYHGRPVIRFLQWMQNRVDQKIPGLYPIVILLDVNSVNDDTSVHSGIISYPSVNGAGQSYVGVVSIGRDQDVKIQIADCVSRFNGVPRLTDKDVRKIDRKLHHHDIFSLLKNWNRKLSERTRKGK
jgi:hypothetical protein